MTVASHCGRKGTHSGERPFFPLGGEWRRGERSRGDWLLNARVNRCEADAVQARSLAPTGPPARGTTFSTTPSLRRPFRSHSEGSPHNLSNQGESCGVRQAAAVW